MDALYPGNIPVGPDGDPLWKVVKVVDAESGRPIAGVRGSVTAEQLYPIPSMPFRPYRSDVSGPDGWVRLRVDGVPGVGTWIYFEAEGYAAVGEMEPGGRAQALERGRDLWLEIRDRYDRPMAGAQVDWHLGCGHTPAVAMAHADAQGRLWLRGVDPHSAEGWLAAAGVESDYVPTGDWRPGEPPIVVRHDFSRPHVGRVVDEHGTPLAGAFVGCSNRHRGPWARTDAQGRFRLIGLGHDDLYVARSRAFRDPECEREAAPPGFERVIRLPTPGDEEGYGTPERWGTLVGIKVSGLRAPGADTEEAYTVTVIDPRDGWSSSTAPDGRKPLPPDAEPEEGEDKPLFDENGNPIPERWREGEGEQPDRPPIAGGGAGAHGHAAGERPGACHAGRRAGALPRQPADD
ncbi:MAG: carboxypeptidase-like regulatory domain-containing protein [Planctomycetota bacterium]